MIPFQSFIHKVLVKIALRLRELGPGSTREKVILVGSGMYNPLHRLHLRMFYLARQFLEVRRERSTDNQGPKKKKHDWHLTLLVVGRERAGSRSLGAS